MKRAITVSIVHTVKSRSRPRESYTICSFMVGHRQLVTYLLEQSWKNDRPTFTMRRIFFRRPSLSSIVPLQPLNLLPIGGTARMDSSLSRAPRDREEKEGPSDRKHQPACLSFLRAIILLWTTLRKTDDRFFLLLFHRHLSTICYGKYCMLIIRVVDIILNFWC